MIGLRVRRKEDGRQDGSLETGNRGRETRNRDVKQETKEADKEQRCKTGDSRREANQGNVRQGT